MAEAPYIRKETVRVIKYRNLKTGRFIKSRSRKTGKLFKVPRGAKKEIYSYRLTTYGAYSLGLRIPDQEIITKKVTRGKLEDWGGRIQQAIGETNIFTELSTGQFLDFQISGQTIAKQKYTLKQSLAIGPIRKKNRIIDLLMWKIMTQMEGAGFRTDYPLPMTSAYRTQREMKALRVLKNVVITVRVRR